MQDDQVYLFEFMTRKEQKSHSCDLFQRLIWNVDTMLPYEHFALFIAATILATEHSLFFLTVIYWSFLQCLHG